jgi:hypothetical protein
MEQTATSHNPRSEQALLDEVIYLASLASDRHMIDPIMNTVRVITAGLQTGAPLASQDRTKLLQVRAQLTDYLLHHDALRSFTEEKLNRQVAKALGVTSQQSESLRNVIKIIAISLATYPVGALVLYGMHVPSPFLLAIICVVTTMYAGFVWLYWSALSTFTPQLKAAYRWICVYMVGLCVVGANVVIFDVFPHLDPTAISRYGGLMICSAVISFFIGYEGIRRFARAAGIRSPIISWPSVCALGIVLCALAMVIPHTTVPDEMAFHAGVTLWIIFGYLATLIALVGKQIARRLTSRYAQAISWHAVANSFAAIICAGVIFGMFTHGPIYTGNTGIIIIAVFGATCGPALTTASYMFSRSVGKS